MRSVLSLLLVPLLLATFAGCEREPAFTSDGKRKVTLKLYWIPQPQFGGFYEAQRIGAFARRGLEVQIVPGNVGAPSLDMVAAGTAEFGLSSSDEILRARAIGKPVVALFSTYQTSPQAIMTPKARGIERFDELFASGTLAIESGKAFSEFLERKYGFEKVKLTESPFGNLTRYLSEADYAMQCFITEEPILARGKGVEPSVFLISESGFNPYVGLVITNDRLLQSDPKLVEDFTAAVVEGWTSYLADPAAANALMHELNRDMDPAAFAASAAAQLPLIQTAETAQLGVGAMTAERWETMGRQLVEVGQIERVPPVAECFRWTQR
jgi:NitT/TauT family transport system substrate-binding protein